MPRILGSISRECRWRNILPGLSINGIDLARLRLLPVERWNKEGWLEHGANEGNKHASGVWSYCVTCIQMTIPNLILHPLPSRGYHRRFRMLREIKHSRLR